MSKFTDTIYILSIFICNISIIDTISDKKITYCNQNTDHVCVPR